MSDYIDRLEAELERAGYRERRRAPLPAALLPFAVVAAVLVAIVLAPSGTDSVERPATPAGAEVQARLERVVAEPRPGRPAVLRISITAAEPVGASVAVLEDGRLLASRVGDVRRGTLAFAIDLPRSAGDGEVRLALTDEQGDVRRIAERYRAP